MAGKLLIGVAAATLFAFGGAGGAFAADVMPIVVPAPVPVVTVAAGPTIEISTEHWLEVNFEPADDNDVNLNSYHNIDLRVTGLSGIGFELFGELEVEIPFDDVDGTATARAFLARNNIEVGVYSTLYLDNGFDGFGLGTDFSFETDLFTLNSYVEAFFDGGFDALLLGGDATVHLLDGRLDIGTGADAAIDGGFAVETVWVGAQVHLGPIAPYATLTWDGGDRILALGTEFEQQLGNSNFSLLAYGEAEIVLGGDTEFNFGVGFKWATGGE